MTPSSLVTLTLLALFAVPNLALLPEGERWYELKDAPALFLQFERDYNRVYENAYDRKIHYAAFVESLKEINEHNAKNPTALFGINKFADYTPEERRRMYYTISISNLFSLCNIYIELHKKIKN